MASAAHGGVFAQAPGPEQAGPHHGDHPPDRLDRESAQGLLRLPWPDLGGRRWSLHDLFSGDRYPRDGDAMVDPGLYVALPAWGFHLLRFA